MTDGNGVKPPGSAEKSLGDIVGDVSAKVSQLVSEEIELAKAEVTLKAKKLGAGAGAGVVAGVFAFFALIMLLHGLAWLLNDLLGALASPWVGFFIVMALLLVLGAILGFLALRFFKKGSPPTPQLAIDEAKKTRAAIEEARR